MQNKEKIANISLNFSKIKIVKFKKKAVIALISAVFFFSWFIFLPVPAWAKLISLDYLTRVEEIKTVIEGLTNEEEIAFKNSLPENENLKVSYEKKVVFTAYNSEAEQCDSTPCITANGFNVCQHGIEDTVAMNGIKMGTKIRIPELFGDRVFVVRDRMNARYGSDRGDVWMLDKTSAKEFGVKLSRVEVLE